MKSFKEFYKNRPKHHKVELGFIQKGSILNESDEPNELDELHKHYGNYTEAHAESIRAYTGVAHVGMNAALYHGHEMHELHQEIDKNLSSALQTHKTPKDIKVYTGIRHPLHKIEPDPNTGKIHLHTPGYTSTSLSKPIAEGFGKMHLIDGKLVRHSLEVHIPEGSHGGYVEQHSEHPKEKEFTLHKGAKFEVDPTYTSSHRDGIEYRSYKARLVHDGVKDVG